MKYINKFYNFMRFRYGIDELYKFLLYLYLAITIINLFLSSRLFSIMELLLFIIIIYRVFSKNISKRKKENDRYIMLKNKILKPFKNLKRNFNDRDYYVYRRCHNCKTTLKLPIPEKRGMKYVKCPKCKKRIKVLILRKQKIEVIKGKEK